MSVVSMIVGRIHVGTPDGEVMREMHRRIRLARLRGEPLTRAQRKSVYLEALECHHENQGLYHRVMTGKF